MRNNRITARQAAAVWRAVEDAVRRTPKLPFSVPNIDVNAIFGDRKSVPIPDLVDEITRAVAIVNN